MRVLTTVAVAFAAALALGSSLAASANTSKGPKPKLPDLVVTQNKLTSDRQLIQDERNTVSYVERTKNQGRGPAKVSYTWFGLLESVRARRGLRINKRRVPALKPRESHGASVTRHYNVPVGKLGGWVAFACANFNLRFPEQHTDNNCKSAGEIGIIARKFTGVVDGTASGGGIKDTWHASTTWTFDHVSESHTYVYALTHADIDYTTSGADSNGCTWSGHGSITTASPDTGSDYLEITYGGENTYQAVASIPAPFYTVNMTGCQQAGQTLGPQALAWIHTGAPLPLTPAHGYTALSDTSDDGTNHDDWRFTAD